MSLSLSIDGPGDAELISAVRGGDIDAYGELVFDHSRPRPLRAFAPEGQDSHVIYISSVSKTLAPGYRVG